MNDDLFVGLGAGEVKSSPGEEKVHGRQKKERRRENKVNML